MAETVQYGWYSPKAAAQTGTTIYRTLEGTEVEVTNVTDVDEDPYGDPGTSFTAPRSDAGRWSSGSGMGGRRRRRDRKRDVHTAGEGDPWTYELGSFP